MGKTAFIEFDKLGVSLIIFGPCYKGNHPFTIISQVVSYILFLHPGNPFQSVHWLQSTGYNLQRQRN